MEFWFLLFFLPLLHAKHLYIVGGNEVTEEGKWPWQGSLRRSGQHICGISLISKRWGVTAAHCVTGVSVPSISVRFGSNNRLSGGQVVHAKQVIKHENHGSGGGISPNDIAVIEFDEDVTAAKTAIIPLAPTGSEHAGNQECWITGWGETRYNSDLPKVLHEANVQVYNQTECRRLWGQSNINDGQVCMGDTKNGRTSCSGDSGGPLVCKVGGHYELVGATSWGLSRCRYTRPSVYSRIAYFNSWISSKTGISL